MHKSSAESMQRVVVKIGYIYSVEINESTKRYFQYVCDDLTQLNSEVIAMFSRTYNSKETPNPQEIVSDQVEFYAHTVIKIGIKLDLWKKYGKAPVVGKHAPIFRQKSIGHLDQKHQNTWSIWKINEDMKNVGLLTEKYEKYFEGAIFSAPVIVDRIKHGKYLIKYPEG